MERRGREAASTVDPADIRRLLTRIGSAARSGFVGARVLALRASTSHAGPRPRGSHRLGRDPDVLHHGPEKADELAGHGDHRDLRPLPIGQMGEAVVQALLRLPGMGDHRGRLALLPAREIHARLRAMAIDPRGLHQHMPTMAVPRLGDRAESLPLPARGLPRHEPRIAGELSGAREAAPVDDLGGEHHRRVERDAAEALQPPHSGARAGRRASCSICRSSSSPAAACTAGGRGIHGRRAGRTARAASRRS